jgi:hypothetical protein
MATRRLKANYMQGAGSTHNVSAQYSRGSLVRKSAGLPAAFSEVCRGFHVPLHANSWIGYDGLLDYIIAFPLSAYH